MIDLHCHLLPGVDDGPSALSDAVELARAMAAAGTRIAVATPHIDHRWGVDPLEVPDRVADLRVAIAAADIDLTVLAGGEVALSRLPELDEDARTAVRLGAGPYLLLEAPLTAAAGDRLLTGLVNQGVPIVLAHPERSATFLRHPHKLVGLVEAGVLCSVTAGSLAGHFGRTVHRFAIRILRDGLVHNVASDAHGTVRRGPDIRAALALAESDLPGVSQLAHWLTTETPEAILTGRSLPPRPEVPRAWECPRPIGGRWRRLWAPATPRRQRPGPGNPTSTG